MALDDFKDYFKILGVSRNATDKEIKSAFRKLARKFHPDLHPHDERAESEFKEINEAYEILSDEDKKKSYEQFLNYWFKNRDEKLRDDITCLALNLNNTELIKPAKKKRPENKEENK